MAWSQIAGPWPGARWHEIGVSLHFIEEGLDTGAIIEWSETDVGDARHPWEIRAISTQRVVPMLMRNTDRLRCHQDERFLDNQWREKGEYFSVPGIFVQLIGIMNFYSRKLWL